MMYTVYHLAEMEKVGCTSRFEARMKEQGFEPLEEYVKFRSSDIAEASWAEAELRKFYGYKEDSTMTYKEKFSKNTDTTTTKVWKDSHYVGWNELNKKASKEDLLKSLQKYSEVSLVTKGGHWTFSPAEYDGLVSKAASSQYKDFYWSTKNLENLKKNERSIYPGDATITVNETVADGPCTHTNQIPEFQQIRDWATERGLYSKGDAKTQYLKLQEEAGEVARAILKSDQPEIIDGLGDVLVVLINLAHLCGYKLEDCLAEAYDVISKRSGKMVNGTFVKTESL